MTITEQQSNAYFATDYMVVTPEGTRKIGYAGEDVNLSGLLHRFDVATAALITAYNPQSFRRSDAINVCRQDKLKRDVSIKWPFLEGEGIGRYEDRLREPSLFVLGITLDEARTLGHKFGQLAILFCTDDGKSELIACNPKDQASLIHPAERMMDRFVEHLRAKGHKVEHVVNYPTGELIATFIPRRRRDPKDR